MDLLSKGAGREPAGMGGTDAAVKLATNATSRRPLQAATERLRLVLLDAPEALECLYSASGQFFYAPLTKDRSSDAEGTSDCQ